MNQTLKFVDRKCSIIRSTNFGICSIIRMSLLNISSIIETSGYISSHVKGSLSNAFGSNSGNPFVHDRIEINYKKNNLGSSTLDQLSINQVQANLINMANEQNRTAMILTNNHEQNQIQIKQEFGQSSSQNIFQPNVVSLPGDQSSKLCAVCNDRASGKHYGVYSCEGCKVRTQDYRDRKKTVPE